MANSCPPRTIPNYVEDRYRKKNFNNYYNNNGFDNFRILPIGCTIVQFIVVISTLITIGALLYFSINIKTKTYVDLTNLKHINKLPNDVNKVIIPPSAITLSEKKNNYDHYYHPDEMILSKKKNNNYDDDSYSKKTNNNNGRKTLRNTYYNKIDDSQLLCSLNSAINTCQEKNAWALPGNVLLTKKYNSNIKFRGNSCNAVCIDQNISSMTGVCTCQTTPI